MIPNPDIITRAAIIQFFEVTMELAWKTLKDYLEDRNLTVHTYDEDKARDIECAIRNSYFPLLNS